MTETTTDTEGRPPAIIIEDNWSDQQIFEDTVTRLGFRPLTTDEPEIFLEWARELQPLLAIVDLWIHESYHQHELPRRGLDILAKLKVVSPTTKRLVVTGDDNPQVIQAVYAQHPDGVISKRARPLRERISMEDVVRRVMRGEPVWDPRLFQLVRDLVDHDDRAAAAARRIASAPLTIREREVLDLLKDRASQAEIARRLIISIKTVKAHVRNLSAKLGVPGGRQAGALARGEDRPETE